MPRQPKPTPPSTTVQLIAIATIHVPETRKRTLRETAELQASILALGLLQPIVLTKEHHLVAGLHRLRACEALGWTTIPAIVVELSDLRAELAEIDENLCRNELTALERAEQFVRRKVIDESLYPQSRAGHAGAAAKHAKARGSSADAVPAFAEQTAGATGKSIRAVQREVQVAEKLSPEVRDLLRHSPLADRIEDLVALAQLGDPAKQMALAKAIASGQAKTLAEARSVLAVEATPAVAAAAPVPAFDQLGHPITDPGIAEAFAVIHERAAEVLRHLRAAKRTWGHFHDEQIAAKRFQVFASWRGGGYGSLRNELEDRLPFMIYSVKASSPYSLCPYCGGAPWTESRDDQCAGCGGVGWVVRTTYEAAPPEMREALDARGLRAEAAPGDDADSAGEDAGITVPEASPGELWLNERATAQARARQGQRNDPGAGHV